MRLGRVRADQFVVAVVQFALQFGDRFVSGPADIPKSGLAAIENSNDRHAAVTVLDRSGLEHARLVEEHPGQRVPVPPEDRAVVLHVADEAFPIIAQPIQSSPDQVLGKYARGHAGVEPQANLIGLGADFLASRHRRMIEITNI
jgi:hypothetical protein